MPVFKIKKDGAWQEVAGVSGHSHSVSQIVDFPSLDGFATEDYVDEQLASKVNIDPTLSIEGQAADAKAVGDAIAAITAELPVVTAYDNGKFLRVSTDGKWVAQSILNAEEVAF